MRFNFKLFGSEVFDLTLGSDAPLPYHGQLCIKNDKGGFEYVDASNMISSVAAGDDCDCGSCDDPEEQDAGTSAKANAAANRRKVGF